MQPTVLKPITIAVGSSVNPFCLSSQKDCIVIGIKEANNYSILIFKKNRADLQIVKYYSELNFVVLNIFLIFGILFGESQLKVNS